MSPSPRGSSETRVPPRATTFGYLIDGGHRRTRASVTTETGETLIKPHERELIELIELIEEEESAVVWDPSGNDTKPEPSRFLAARRHLVLARAAPQDSLGFSGPRRGAGVRPQGGKISRIPAR